MYHNAETPCKGRFAAAAILGRRPAGGPAERRRAGAPRGAPALRVFTKRRALYLISTVAPASSSCFLASSASSLVTPSLIALGARLDDVLGLLETEAGQRAHDLDDLDLLVAEGGQDDVERGLLFGRGGGLGGGRSRGHGHRAPRR